MHGRWEVGDAEWELLEPILRPARRADHRGRPWHDTRAVLNGVLWVLGTGAQWRELPSKYPPFQTCHRRFQAVIIRGSDGSRSIVLYHGLLWTALLIFGGVAIPARGDHRRKKGRLLWLSVTCVALVMMIACGGGGPSASPPTASSATGKPAGTYTITVAGTSSTVSRTIDLKLTVN